MKRPFFYHLAVYISCLLVLFSNSPFVYSQSDRDLPPPTANLTNIPAGSLVIAMDTTNQAIVAPFNLRAYGLANNLLQNQIPVMWAIRTGKAKDGVDFSAQAQRISPTTTAVTNYNFSGGPFIIHRDFAELAKPRIASFGNNVAVYQLTQDVVVDIRYTLNQKINVAVSNDSSSIHTNILVAASIPNYAIVNPTALSANSCYTVHTEPHTSATAGIPNVRAFVESGGNVQAQCAAVLTLENNAFFATTTGLVVNNVSTVMTYPNADLAFSQFTGVLAPAPGGSEQDYGLRLGSTYRANTHAHAQNSGTSSNLNAAFATKVVNSGSGPGGMVFYMGGHDYNGSGIDEVNGRRMYLNAIFTPATRPLSCGINFATTLQSISGTIYEDINGDSVLSDGVGRPNVNLRLYADANNNGVVDTGDTFISNGTTDLNGRYSFQVSTAASGNNYLVAVDSKSVTPSAGFNAGSAQGDVWAEQTYGDDPTTAAIDLGSRFSGRQGLVSDNFNPSVTTPANNAYEHMARVSLGLGNVTNLDFAFSFNVVTNMRAGDTADDDTTANRTVQGSLRQFIQNANAIAGANYMRLVPANGVALNGGTYWQVAVSNQLPALTDSNTTIDGIAYNFTNGISVRDTNAGSLGAGGAVGTENINLPAVERPEFAVLASGSIALGLDLQGSSSTVRNIAIHGFGTAVNNNSGANIRISATGTSALIERNIIGTNAVSFTDLGSGARGVGDNIRSVGAQNGILRNNLIGFGAGRGFSANGNSTGWLIENNEIRGNGIGNPNLGGIGLETVGTNNNIIRFNLVIGNEGVGVDSNTSGGANTILNNSITNNGIGSGANAETAGVRIGGNNNLIDRNNIFSNYGAGVQVISSANSNVITRNSIYANGTVLNKSGAAQSNQIGIDLQSASDNIRTGTSPFVTLNDMGDGDSGGNGLLNFPVLESAQIVNGNLVLKGFSGAGSALELFIAAPDPSGFGEGQTYLLTVNEGSGADLDTTVGTYTSPFVEKNVGTDTTSRFEFSIPLPSAVSIGAILTSTATVAGTTSEFSNTITVASSPPLINLLKSVSPEGVQLPGTELIYTIAFTNVGGQSASNFILLDPDPANTAIRINTNTDFKIDSVINSMETTGLTAAVSYSNDNGITFSYVPVSGGGGAPAGYDSNVTHIRWAFTGVLSPTAPNNSGSISFVVRIR
jgi:hypothetical protein